MEIFRTDSGGRMENPLRLIAVIAEVEKTIPQTSSFWKKILAVNDHKGKLNIVIYPGVLNDRIRTKLLYLFGNAWENQLEDYSWVDIHDADEINFIPIEDKNNISVLKIKKGF